jgi:membrane protein implicated in regulation of membrane protease activity
MIGGLESSWLWLIGGVVLLIAEVIAPGFFLMFIGAAAIITGIAALVLPIGLALQLALFAVMAIVIARYGGRRAYASRYDLSTDPLLNDRVGRLLGRVVVVVDAVDSKGGRVRVGDNSRSRLHVGHAVTDDDRPDRNAAIEVAREIEISDGPRVETTRIGLQLRDNLHRADLGCTRNRSRGKT